jgi:hypothetical protein
MFFIPDIPHAVVEMRRVLRPGGALLVVTMAHVYMDELRVVINRALEKLGTPAGYETRYSNIAPRFSLESGQAYLAPYFRVTGHQLESAFVFPEVEPVLAYVASSRDVIREDWPSGRTWAEFITALRSVVSAEIAAHGEFRVSKNAGVLAAVK